MRSSRQLAHLFCDKRSHESVCQSSTLFDSLRCSSAVAALAGSSREPANGQRDRTRPTWWKIIAAMAPECGARPAVHCDT